MAQDEYQGHLDWFACVGRWVGATCRSIDSETNGWLEADSTILEILVLHVHVH